MSKRLKLISEQINKDEKVLDVGTDHCLLPILLLENNITKNIVASDINPEPLKAGERNLIQKNLQDQVELRLMDGLEGIELSNFDVIVIAGMGATTISNMLKNFDGRYLIHSTTHIPDVRKAILEIGHTIENEWVDVEGKIFNVIIETKKGKSELTEKEIYLGPKLMAKQESKEYFEFLLSVLIKNRKDSGIEDLKEKEILWLKEQLN